MDCSRSKGVATALEWSIFMTIIINMIPNETERNGTERKGEPDRNLLYQFDGHV